MRLIDADKLKAHYAWWGNDGAEYRERKADFDVIVDLQPTVDQTKHGRWIKDKRVYGFSRCSECGSLWEQTFVDNLFTKYCPRCGARMDGGENE